MGELLRSVKMSLLRFLVPDEASHETIFELGKLGIVNFRDLNSNLSAFQRPFIEEARRLDDLEKILVFFESQLDFVAWGDIPQDRILTKEEEKEIILEDLDNLEGNFENLQTNLRDLLRNETNLLIQYYDLKLRVLVLEKVEKLLAMEKIQNLASSRNNTILSQIDNKNLNKNDSEDDINEIPLLEIQSGSQSEMGYESDNTENQKGLQFVCGTIPRERVATLERILWRATLGNIYLKTVDLDHRIKNPRNNTYERRCVFIIFFQGIKTREKILRVCTLMSGNLHQIPEKKKDRIKLSEESKTQIQDLKEIIESGKKHKIEAIIGLKIRFPVWYERIHKEKSIYNILNLFKDDETKKVLIAEGWAPENSITEIRECIEKATDISGSTLPTIIDVIERIPEDYIPPTYFPVNNFQKGFQDMVDSYGIANYGEINPAPFSIITFPFLFAVMFGDVGHGLLLTSFAIWVLFVSKKLEKISKVNEIVKVLYDGRYIILLMGIFSIYTGLIYNEFFSLSMNLFGTCWEPRNNSLVLDLKYHGCTYPIGIDPSWWGATTELLYSDSLKMKLSVLFGVTQMLFGIILSLFNHIHFKKWLNILFEFLPQVILLSSFFGYMNILIIDKWVTDWSTRENQTGGVHLITTLIKMALSPMGVSAEDEIYQNQNGVQFFLLIVFVLCIPWMLLPKPFILRHRAKQKIKRGYKLENSSNTSDSSDSNFNHVPVYTQPFEFSEVMINQLIHTIEFVLGSISNTASYLRLWALSLAHSQLSKVFWEMIFITCAKIKIGGSLAIVFGFCAWACLTIGVLLIMECLSAFLHALRLHWVEFNTKFYISDKSKKFEPFTFKYIKNEIKNFRK
ncbi:vacuolar proton atpase [Anaeramoeba flamelloides]|uniref:V-type proton ATPase subunit a n=1 Tax=Anaeramoeba flamelloides TaxID=1746091 RepID=A0AAV7Z1A6_9EUKA|nr:vacuolar proton atpase [Anaeramoeba flamelloides]